MKSIFGYRDLALTMIKRELTIRYKRSALGAVWALAEPLFMVAVYVMFFGHVLHAGEGITNYALFTLTGMLPWIFFSSTLEQSSGALLEHGPLIRKVYFPREILILAVEVSRLSTLAIGLALGVVIAAIPGFAQADIQWNKLWLLPSGLVLLVSLVLGLSLVLAALQVMLRDVGFLLRFALRLGFFACPITYPLTRVPEWFRPWYELNPLVGLTWFFQAFTDPGVPMPSIIGVTSAIAWSLGGLVFGWWMYRKIESSVMDLL